MPTISYDCPKCKHSGSQSVSTAVKFSATLGTITGKSRSKQMTVRVKCDKCGHSFTVEVDDDE